ncbi:hypothetical protein C2G38_2203955 [Gigaspora rosea]|uniref:Uncharacterized protein n=1 Tax=Gigaspora rosea TaxID=44941 RepID=A0A397UR24_9GLOM|nr:hypothetical protein C2G38_2203955 [Gigaspora rosea]
MDRGPLRPVQKTGSDRGPCRTVTYPMKNNKDKPKVLKRDESGLKKDTYSMHTMYQGSADIRNIDYHSKIVVEKVKSVGSSAKEDHKAIAEHVDKEIIFVCKERIKNEAVTEHQKSVGMDDARETKLEELNQKGERKTVNVPTRPEDEILDNEVGNDDGTNEGRDIACEEWNEKIDEFLKTVGEAKKLTWMKPSRTEETSYAGCCYQDEIGVKVYETLEGYLGLVGNDDSDGHFDPRGFYERNESGLVNSCERWKKRDVVLSQVVQGPAEGETLRCACGSWLKKVEEFQNSSKVGDREGIGVENEVIWKSSDIGIEEGMMNIGRCYRDGIEWYVKRGEFDPGGFYYQSGIVAVKYEEKALELYPKPAKDKDPDTQDYLGNRSFAIIILKNTFLTFDAAAGRVKESVKMEPNRSKGKMELEKLAESRHMMNLTKENFQYLLTRWSCSQIFDPGGMFLGKAQQREWSRGTSTLSRGEIDYGDFNGYSDYIDFNSFSG